KPIILQGVGASISSGNVSPTVLSYTGSGIAIDLHGASGVAARGTILKDFQLVNAGTGTIGIRVNDQEPKLENVYLYQTNSGTAGFSTAAIRVGDLVEVNDLLMRDVYIRAQPTLGIDLWHVSEGTLDHIRLIQNAGYQLKIGDAGAGLSCQGLNVVNGTAVLTAQASGSGGFKIERSQFKLNIDGCYLESDSASGAFYAIDARTATVCDQLLVKNTYLNGSAYGSAAAYAISVGVSSVNVEIDGC